MKGLKIVPVIFRFAKWYPVRRVESVVCFPSCVPADLLLVACIASTLQCVTVASLTGAMSVTSIVGFPLTATPVGDASTENWRVFFGAFWAQVTLC